MTVSHPPRLATALLYRVFDEDEPLVGDLLEGFGRHPSRLWFWRQTLSAIAFRSRRPSRHNHPLGLAPRSVALRIDAASTKTAWRPINLSASPVTHAGGLGVVILATLVAVVRPQAWWLFVPAIVGGIVIAVAIGFVRRRHERG